MGGGKGAGGKALSCGNGEIEMGACIERRYLMAIFLGVGVEGLEGWGHVSVSLKRFGLATLVDKPSVLQASAAN